MMIVNPSFLVHVSSEESKNRFPGNSSVEFTVELKEPLTGNFLVALDELVCNDFSGEQIIIFSDIVEPYQVYNTLSPALRVLRKPGSVQNLQFLKLSRSVIQRIRFWITDNKFNLPATNLGEVSFSLRFLPY